MLEALALMIGLIAPDYTASVAVEAALVLHTTKATVGACCGRCKDGVITHGDGHTTQCPCPADCKCKTRGAVTHNPVVLKCQEGKCTPKR